MATKNKKPYLATIGHRGAMGSETENTIASMKKAIDLDVDYIEIDIQLTRDNHLVVFHDRKVNRLTNDKGKIINKTLEQIRALRVGKNQRIPTLVEALNAINHQKTVIIEIKKKGTADILHKHLHNLIKKKKWKSTDFIVSTVHKNELRKLKQLNGNFRLNVLVRSHPLKCLKFAREINAYSIQVYKKYCTKKLVNKAHRIGLKIFIYTLNRRKEIARYKKWRLDGITTNYPERIAPKKER